MGIRASIFFLAMIWTLPSAFADSDPFAVFPTKPVVSLGSEYLNADLFKVYAAETAKLKGKTSTEIAAAIARKNQQMMEALDRYTPGSPSTQTVASITEAQAQALHEAIAAHPVVSDSGAQQYDGPTRMIGYCFGRASFVHLELLRRGVNPQSIGKIFAIGKFHYRGSIWDFHVATVVRSTGGSWWAIDGYGDKPLLIKDWSKEVQKWSREAPLPRTRFYFTDAAKFQPTSGAYAAANMSAPYYHGYFYDLAKWFVEHPVKEDERFITPRQSDQKGERLATRSDL